MSADMMIICDEDESAFDADGDSHDAFFIDETSMGEPWNEFGQWFQRRYCQAPSMVEKLAGAAGHNYVELTESDKAAIQYALERLETHDQLREEKLMQYVDDHISKHISTENW